MLNHFDALGNEYLTPLQEANALHLTARARYHRLADKLKADGIKFKDVGNFLFNQAKKSGLYRKNHYDSSKGKFTFKPKSRIAHLGWVVAIKNFTNWLYKNYSDYSVPAKPKAPKDPEGKVTIRKNSKGEVTEVETVEKGVATRKQAIEAVTKELSPSQVLSILKANWSVLEDHCKDKGAEEEFQALMVALAD